MANMFVKKQELRRKQLTERERIQENVRKEDFLIKQIDEFKDKAKQLQMLLDTKEDRVQELQGIVEERERKARSLQEVLKEKQMEVDHITKGVEGYANKIALQLENQITQLKEEMKTQGNQPDVGVELLTASINNLSDITEKYTANLNVLAASMETDKTKIDDLTESLKTMESELSEKIHTENVKCYRNVQASLEELKDQMGVAKEQEDAPNSLKGWLKAAIAIGAVNLVVLVAFFLYELGVMNQFM